MKVMKSEASIDIIRKSGKLVSLSVVMPIWDKVGDDNVISINIPMFGIKTFAKDVEDSDDSIREAIKAFCISADKFGKGLEIELKLLGWSFVEQSQNSTSMSFCVSNRNSVVDQMMQTGEQFVENLQLVS